MNKLLLANIKFWLIIFLLMPLELDATTFNQGTVYVKNGEFTTVELPSSLINEYNYHGSGGLSWRVSNSCLVIGTTAMYHCSIMPRNGTVFADNVKLTCQFYSFYGTSLMDNEVVWDVKLSQSKIYVTNIALSSTVVSLNVGETMQLTATVSPNNATNKSVTWSSDKESVATVSSSGLVTAKASGNATITCNANDGSNCQASCNIIVGEIPDPGVIVEPTDDWSNYGNYSISWFNKNKTEFTISTNKELAGLSYLVANGYSDFRGVTIKLGADIDLSGKYWRPIGNENKKFCGSFDGQGHKIGGIYIGFIPEQIYYGFFGRTDGNYYTDAGQYIETITIKNTVFKGIVNVKDAIRPNKKKEEFFVGGITGLDTYTLYENCICEMPICFRMKANENAPDYYIGGIVGRTMYSKINYCKHEGDILFEDEDETGGYPHIGGIAGDGYNSRISYSENISNIIRYYSISEYGSTKKDYYIGLAPNASLQYCRNIVNTIDLGYFAGGRTMEYTYHIYAVSGTNCYSSISKIIGNSTYNPNHIIKLISGGAASFINSDIATEMSKMTCSISNSASISFTSKQMQTPTFLEELNIYSVLNLGGPIWAQDEDGGFPYIANLHDTSSISVQTTKIPNDAKIYTLSGQRLQAPKKGINIIGGKKVVIK